MRDVLERRAGSYSIIVKGGEREAAGSGPPQFEVYFANRRLKGRAMAGDVYTAAMAYVRGDIDVSGDVRAAIAFFAGRAPHGLRQKLFAALGYAAAWRPESLFQSRKRAADNIRRHYDRSNEFYRLFLGPTMTYSCAYFRNPEWDVDRAQQAKLEHVLRKLDVRRGERFLDIGCGWGSLVEAAAARGAKATGCTLSPAQLEWARGRASANSELLLADYRDLSGRWDKIASIGMVEHVGRRRLRGYFARVNAILREGGLFLNHGIVRPQTVRQGAESLFLQRMVFPGAEVPHLGEMIRAAEEGGFEVLDVENLRLHYALTTRAWVERLTANAAECEKEAGRETYRTWVLYLAGCGRQFEAGHLDVYQTLLAKRSAPVPRRMSRDYMYAGPSAEWGG